METQIGLELCTAGSAEKITVDGTSKIEAATLMILSPLFPMLETGRSADYQSVVLQDTFDAVFPLLAQHLPTAQHLYYITPFRKLSEEQQLFFLQSIARIRDKERELIDITHPVRRKLQETMITLLKHETLLECAFLFSEQLLNTDKQLSHKREVLMTFLLSLNQEYKQHREVSYYAAKQGMTPRRFSNIVRQESGFTPMEWINRVTIDQAKNLLRQPDILVKQVADELGFPEQFTFRKYFKTHTGISPSEFQKQK